MSDVADRLRRLVVNRAGNRCEYCRLSQEGQAASFHIDHITPRARGGATEPDNLALACVSCSLRKAARRSALDPLTGRKVSLFHPRRQPWSRYFRWEGMMIVGSTPTGRATVHLLDMNRPLTLAIRLEESQRSTQLIVSTWPRSLFSRHSNSSAEIPSLHWPLAAILTPHAKKIGFVRLLGSAFVHPKPQSASD